MADKERDFLAKTIVDQHKGRVFLTFQEAGKVMRIHPDYVGYKLHKAGITVKKIGTKKLVSVYDLVRYMCSERVAPIDNTSRPA